jgi:hypothetical protein
MKAIRTITLILITALASGTMAQKVTLKSGTLDFLKGHETIRVDFTYDDMTVGKMKEADYIAKKTKEYNEKEPGRGDQWAQDWVNDRQGRFQPRFVEGFDNMCSFAGVTFRIDPNAAGEYYMIVHTLFTEPGFNIYMTSKNASIDAEVTFYDGAKTELAKIFIDNSPGSGFFEFDYDTGIRIQEAYANGGRSLAAFILDKVFGKK